VAGERTAPPVLRPGPETPDAADGKTARREVRKARRRARIAAAIAVLTVLGAAGAVLGAYYVDTVPTPDQLALPQSTTIYYADGKTPMAKLGTENRKILRFDEMNDADDLVIVVADDRCFGTNQ